PRRAPRRAPRGGAHQPVGHPHRALMPSARAIGIALALALLAPACAAAPPPPRPPPPKKYEPPDERFVVFLVGNADVPADGFYSIGYVAAQLDADPALRVLVVGHADQHGRPEGSREMSFRRAQAVRRVLIEHGVKPERISIATPHDLSETKLAQTNRR